MSTIIIWNEEKKRHEKWAIKNDIIDVSEIGVKNDK